MCKFKKKIIICVIHYIVYIIYYDYIADADPTTTMEQYTILGRVGEGAHGIVLKAKHIEVNIMNKLLWFNNVTGSDLLIEIFLLENRGTLPHTYIIIVTSILCLKLHCINLVQVHQLIRISPFAHPVY